MQSKASNEYRHSLIDVSPVRPLQQLLIRLACSDLADMSMNGRIDSLGFTVPLGNGATFSVVRREARGRKLVAIKHIIQDDAVRDSFKPQSAGKMDRIADVLLEVEALLHYPLQKHPNIVDLLAYGWDDGTFPFLVLEYADLGSLNSFLQQTSTTTNEKKSLAIDIASGLELLHACEIIHGDIKLENVLVFSNLGKNYTAKLSDFGFCCSEALGNKIYRGTRVLNAPELRKIHIPSPEWQGHEYMKCDIYSYGLALWEIFNNGKRFYCVDAIGIDSEDLIHAEQFLLQLDRDGKDLTFYANNYLETLDISPETTEAIHTIFQMTLPREPDKRSNIREVRLQIDTKNERKLELTQPLRVSHYSIFDITATPLPWRIRTELVSQYQATVDNAQNDLASQALFNLAACYATGFGVELNSDIALDYLAKASEYMYKPARVLYRIFHTSGLIENPVTLKNLDSLDQSLDSIQKSVAPLPQQLHFSARLRQYYRRENARRSSSLITIKAKDITLQTEAELWDFLIDNIGILHEFVVDLEINGDQLSVPLLHHLIASHEHLAEAILRKGADVTIMNNNSISLLDIACSCGSTTLVRILLELLPESASHVSSALHWLFMFQDSEIHSIAEMLVDHGVSFKTICINEFKDFNLVFSGTALNWAVMARNTTAVRALVELGAKVNQSYVSRSPYWQYPSFPLDLAVCLLLPEMVELLVSLGAEIRSRPENGCIPALHYIGETVDPFRIWLIHGRGYKEAVKDTIEALLRSGANIDEESDDGITALHYTAERTTCLTYVLEGLLHFNPTVFTGEDSQRSPMYFASIALGYDPVNSAKMKIIVDYCAKILEPTEFQSASRRALKNCTRDGTVGAAREILTGLSPREKAFVDEGQLLHIAAEYNETEMIRLFLDLGADVNLDAPGTPACCAAQRGKRDALALLLSRGSSVFTSPTSASGTSLLHEIVGSSTSSPDQSFYTLRFVWKHFRCLFLPVVDNYDDFGFTALHSAIIWANIRNVATLLEKFHASPLEVQDTNISPTTLTILARKDPPWHYAQLGNDAIKEYQRSLDVILAYLIDVWELDRPDLQAHSNRLSEIWTSPSESFWEEEATSGEWFLAT